MKKVMIAAAALIIGGTAFANAQTNAKPAATTTHQAAPAATHETAAQKKEVKEEKMEKKEATRLTAHARRTDLQPGRSPRE